MRAAILWNPLSGRGRAQEIAERLQAAIERRGGRCELRPTTERGSGIRWAQEQGADVDRLFVLGGDGTLREVAEGNLAREQPIAMGHVPMGNANVVAQELGIPLDVDAAMPALLDGTPAPFDVMWADERLVIAVVGIGFDGEAAHLLDRARQGPLRRWYRWHGDSLYGAVGMFTLLKPGWRRLELALDGEPLPGHYTGCMISNMRTYARGWAPNPGADAQDGRFDFQALRPSLVPSTALALLAAARRKALPDRLARQGQGLTMRVQSASPFYWQADGDPMEPCKALTVRLEAGVLPLIVPKTPG